MPVLAKPELLTPALVHKTSIPSPPYGTQQPTSIDTILVTACSEFKEYSVPASAVDGRHKLCIVLDGQDQPMIFTVGNDSRFYCIHHVSGEAWQLFDITPSGEKSARVSAFDVFQHSTGKVAISVAIAMAANSDDSPIMYHAEPVEVKAKDFKPSGILFYQIKDKNHASLSITSVTIAASDKDMTQPSFMVVGTAERETKRATDYVVSTDPNNEDPWRDISLPDPASEVVKAIPATGDVLGAYVISLLRSVKGTDPVNMGSTLSCFTLDSEFNVSIQLKTLGGGARDISTAVTSVGLSDLYVAGVKGIGYYASQIIDRDPQVLLPEISFQQVIASENNLKVSVFAVSVDGYLYYISGERTSTGVVPTFKATGYPIRKNVGILSTQYNVATNACEVVYFDSDNGVKHLWRDPSTTMWSEQAIHVPSPEKVVSFPAFVSQAQLKGISDTGLGVYNVVAMIASLGKALFDPQKFVQLLSSSEVAYVLVNDKTHRLDKNPSPFETDPSGYIRIVFQAYNTFTVPKVTLTIKDNSREDSVEIEPGQRLVRQWSNVKSGADLKHAKSTAGQAVFPDTKIDDHTFNAVAGILQHIPKVVSRVDPSAVPKLGRDVVDSSSGDISVAYEKRSIGDWMDDLIDVSHDIGDFFESIGDGIVEVFKFGIKIVGDVVNFFAEIAGKVLRFVLDTIGAVIRSIAVFLKDVLGIDIMRFLALFGFLWDYPNILRTQQIIVQSARKGAETLQDIVSTNTPWLKEYIRNCHSLIAPYITDERVSEADDSLKNASASLGDSFLGQLLQKVFDNPIIREVMRYASLWLLKAVSLVEDEISFPGIDALENLFVKKFPELLEKLLVKEATNLVDFFRDIFNKLGDLISGKRSIGDFFTTVFSDLFWTFFDAIQDIALALIDILPDLFSSCLDILTGEIEIPGISAFWKSFTSTSFSIIDVCSMIVAQVLYLVTMMWKEQLPFEVMPPWYELLPKKGSVHFPPIGESLDSVDDEYSEIETAGASAFPPAAIHTLCDLSFGWASSIAGLVSSILAGYGNFPAGRLEGFNLPRTPQDSVGFNYETPTRTGSALIRNGDIACFCVNMLMKFASLCNTLSNPQKGTGRTTVLPILKFVGFTLSGVSLVFSVKKQANAFTLSLVPVGTLINALPGGIWTFLESQKGKLEQLALSSAMIDSGAAGCNIITIVCDALEQPHAGLAVFIVATGLNFASLGTTIGYGCQFLSN